MEPGRKVDIVVPTETIERQRCRRSPSATTRWATRPQLRRVADRRAGAGEDELLPQLAGRRRTGPVSHRPQLHGGHAHRHAACTCTTSVHQRQASSTSSPCSGIGSGVLARYGRRAAPQCAPVRHHRPERLDPRWRGAATPWAVDGVGVGTNPPEEWAREWSDEWSSDAPPAASPDDHAPFARSFDDDSFRDDPFDDPFDDQPDDDLSDDLDDHPDDGLRDGLEGAPAATRADADVDADELRLPEQPEVDEGEHRPPDSV
jgi:hypothetical protein